MVVNIGSRDAMEVHEVLKQGELQKRGIKCTVIAEELRSEYSSKYGSIGRDETMISVLD